MVIALHLRRVVALALPLACACEETKPPPVSPVGISATADATEPGSPAAAKKQSPHERTLRSAVALSRSVYEWRTKNPDQCPTAERLKQEKALAPEAGTTDAWDSPFKIMCDEETSIVVSFGADRREGTPDDLRVGPPMAPPSSAASPTTVATAAVTPAVDAGSMQPLLPNGMLSPAVVLTVVRAGTPVLKKKCWDTGVPNQLAGANVTLTVVVGLTGSVQSTSVSGDEPVASCIAREASAWTFPAPATVTPVNVPFRFVR